MANPIVAGLTALSAALTGTQPTLTVGDAPTITITPAGGFAPYSARVVGQLPPGRTLTNLLITGAFTTAGTYPYAIAVTDAVGNTTTVYSQPTVAAAPVAPPKDTNLYFASNRERIPQGSTFAVAAGHEYSMIVTEDVSPPYATNGYRAAFTDHTMAQNVDNAEQAISGPVNILGYVMAYQAGTQWVFSSVAPAFTMDPSAVFPTGHALAGQPLGGAWSDEMTFPSDVPANSRLQRRAIINVAAGVSLPNTFPNKGPVATYYSGQTPTYQSFVTGAPTDRFSSHLLDQVVTNSLGTTTGYQFAATIHVCRATKGLDRPVFAIHGDSIANGSNQNGTNVSTVPGGAVGFLSMGLDDSIRSRRMTGYSMSASGTSGPDMIARPTGQRHLNLLRQLPNRPYTHVISEFYTNSSAKDTNASTFTANMKAVHALLKSESRAWNGTAAPLYQVRAMVNANSTDLFTSAAGLTNIDPLTGGQFKRWPFDADLVGGNVYTDVDGLINPQLALSQDQASLRAQPAILTYSSTLTADAATAQNVIVVGSPCARGDTVVVNPGGTGQTQYSVASVSADGLTVTLSVNLAQAWPTGTVIKKALKSDPLHPSTMGHYAVKTVVENWKNSVFG